MKKTNLFQISFDTQSKMTFKDFKELGKSDNNDQSEADFWSNLKKPNRTMPMPIYAIDNELSRYPKKWAYWNLNELTTKESLLQVSKIPGVTTPYTNFGQKFTSFGMHIEDSNMASINMHHEGADRYWYSIPSSDSQKLELYVQKQVPKSIECDSFIRHKSLLLSPEELSSTDIKFAKVNIPFGFL